MDDFYTPLPLPLPGTVSTPPGSLGPLAQGCSTPIPPLGMDSGLGDNYSHEYVAASSSVRTGALFVTSLDCVDADFQPKSPEGLLATDPPSLQSNQSMRQFPASQTSNLPAPSSNFSLDELRQHMLQGVPIPPREPLNLSTHFPVLPPAFNSLCIKGSKFIPTPKHVDWLDIQRDFDRFSNMIRYKANNFDPSASTSEPPAASLKIVQR